MLVREHAATARELLIASDADFDKDDLVQASEKLWGAAAHAVMAVAQQRNWSCDKSHRSLKITVIRLSREQGDPLIEGQFGAAEKFYRNFFQDDMEDYERDADRPLVHDFVARVLALLESDSVNGTQ